MVTTTPKKLHSFFKVYLPEPGSEELFVPDAFVARLTETFPERVILKSPTGRCWPVKMQKHEGHVFFQKGWKSFVEDNALEICDFIVFSYVDISVISFKIFGKSGCQKRETDACIGRENGDRVGEMQRVRLREEERGKKKVEEEEDVDEEEEEVESVEELETFNRERGHKKVKRNKSGEDKGDVAVASKNPFFEVTLTKERTSRLHVPTCVLKDFNLELDENITFIDPLQRKWPAKVIKWKDGRTWIKGWRPVCRWNALGEHDVCRCEFLLGNDRRATFLKVEINRRQSI